MRQGKVHLKLSLFHSKSDYLINLGDLMIISRVCNHSCMIHVPT